MENPSTGHLLPILMIAGTESTHIPAILTYGAEVDDSTQAGKREKLIRHLKWVNDVCPESFNLADWHNEKINAVEEKFAKHEPLDCGFCGCVIGHTPLLFPDLFAWDDNQVMCLVGGALAEEQAMADVFGGTMYDWSRIIYSKSYTRVCPDDGEYIEEDLDDDGEYIEEDLDEDLDEDRYLPVPLSAVIVRIEELHKKLENEASVCV